MITLFTPGRLVKCQILYQGPKILPFLHALSVFGDILGKLSIREEEKHPVISVEIT